MTTTLVGMSKQKPTGGKHKPRRMVGIPEKLAVVLEKLGESRMQNLTELVKTVCVEYLTRLDLWPPKPAK